MDLEFNHKTGLKDHEIKECQRIVHFLIEVMPIAVTGWVSGKHIAEALGIEQVTVRKHIQHIREYNDEFFTGAHYIIASKKGYKVTSNIKEIKKFAKSVHKRAKSALAQVDQAYKITRKGW